MEVYCKKNEKRKGEWQMKWIGKKMERKSKVKQVKWSPHGPISDY